MRRKILNIEERLEYLSNEENVRDRHWYVIKQGWSIAQICLSTKILKYYKQSNDIKNMSFENYFNKKLEDLLDKGQLESGFNFRCVSNGEYIGLIKTPYGTRNYSEKEIMPVFNIIDEKANESFLNIEDYYDIIENQIEKMYLTNIRDQKEERSKYLVHPTFVTYKTLLLIGYQTKEFKISMDEFKVFVCFIEKYEDVYTAVDFIIKSRVKYKNKIAEISKHADNIRIHKVLNFLKTFKLENKYISLNTALLSEIENKVKLYENLVENKVSKNNMDDALFSNLNIFEFYQKEE